MYNDIDFSSLFILGIALFDAIEESPNSYRIWCIPLASVFNSAILAALIWQVTR